MKTLITTLVATSLLVSCEPVQGKTMSTRPLKIDMQKTMQEFMRLGTPGEEHKELAKQVGNWKTTMRHRDGPDGEWQTMTGTATYEPLFDGRFVIGRDKGVFEMNGQKMPYESMLILGFDSLKKEWTSRYYGSMSTWSGELRGKKNDKGEIEFEGVHVDHITPDGRPSKAVSRWEGNDKMVFEMWDSIGGKMVHTMTWIADRVK